jgi:alkaline phosphatase
MLDEMTAKALEILSRESHGFYLMVEGAQIDKQAHAMDSDRWLMEVIEFDRAVAVARDFAKAHPDTLVIVTADHETGGSSIIGASKLTNADLQQRSLAGGGVRVLRDAVVGTYDDAGFPRYTLAADGYPETMDPDHKLLIGYGSGADHNEDWLSNPRPLVDTQQPIAPPSPFPVYPAGYPRTMFSRDFEGGYTVAGTVPGGSATHTGTDVPLSAFGRGSSRFFGVIDNTDVFFKIASAVLAGSKSRTTPPEE